MRFPILIAGLIAVAGCATAPLRHCANAEDSGGHCTFQRADIPPHNRDSLRSDDDNGTYSAG